MKYARGAKSFSIRHGTCTLYGDRMEIHTRDFFSRVGAWAYQKGMRTAAPLIFALISGLFLATILSLLIENFFLAAFFGISIILAGWYVAKNRTLSFAPKILKSQIARVTYRKAVPGVAWARFEVYFREKEQGRLLKRVLVIPNRIYNGTSLADTAFWILKDEGYLRDQG